MNYSDFIHLLITERELSNNDCCKNKLTMIIKMVEKDYAKEVKVNENKR
jgi:hypothetical protein